MNVWILQTGEPLHIDEDHSRPMRAMNLSNKLAESGHNVVIFSSTFYHQKKSHRAKKYSIFTVSENIEIRLIPSIGYYKHIGLRRLFDHFQMAWNLKKLLKKEESFPDIAFIGYPPIESAWVMSKWLKKKGVPMLLDVKDLWPTIFLEPFPRLLKPLASFLFYFYFYLAKKTINNADGISTMSESFLKWALTFSGKANSSSDRIVKLTSIDNKFSPKNIELSYEWWYKKGLIPRSKKFFFIGTFSSSFEFDEIYIAASKLSECQFILCGDGPELVNIKAMMSPLSNVIFPGWIDEVKIKSLSYMSSALIAPYKNIDNFSLNIPNKIVDSFLLGLPVLTSLNGEVEKLINSHNVGFIYGPNFSFIQCIESLINNEELQKEISKNARDLYESEFEYNLVYGGLVSHLEYIHNNNS